MRKVLKLELCRGFCNRTFGVTLLFGICLSVYHTFEFVFPNMGQIENWIEKGAYPPSLFNQWIGGEKMSLQAFLYGMLIPCLAILPYAESMFSDIRTGYIKMLLTKVPRREFLLSRLIAVFLTGGTACVFILLFDLVSTAVWVPALRPDVASHQFALHEKCMFNNIFYENPLLYIGIYLIIIFLYSGLFACIGLCIGFYAESKASIFIIPFAGYMLIDFAAIYFSVMSLSPHTFLDIAQGWPANFNVIVVEFIIASVVVLLVYYRKGKAYEIY